MLEGDVRADVLVIGGGMAGVLSAHPPAQAGCRRLPAEEERGGGGGCVEKEGDGDPQPGLGFH